MELILKETIDSLGQEGDIVNVKPGYGRNFLLPQGKAVQATAENLAILEQNKAEIEARLDAQRQKAQSLFNKLNNMTVIFEELAAEDERLFGSVSAHDIHEKLSQKDVVIERKSILLNEPIKNLGEHSISIKVGFDMLAEIVVHVVARTDE
ncbi:MAG: 50S ribosomal protein L9 [Desulfofustis sp. PB-SRB1]|jgi:large subunit ribosomal protein L9|nr:50S ribosomal protein L9 [Desulfofustis sp. PB-SRB1]MBM1001452.1 50S ribosomal protein L9 [Desulfofustis sp. PB-SRB1]HBH28978.1 50S ribosomal protein L9 [Desulfofustis sp.]HBH31417.1 50S ribosomal protein L9 [Desulfofustis sp.]